MTVQVRLEVIERHKAGALLHPLFFPELDVVALVDRLDLLTAGAQEYKAYFDSTIFFRRVDGTFKICGMINNA